MSAVRSLVWDPPVLRLLDQRQLPARVEELVCRTPEEVGEAIRSLAVRGAPAIGMAAAFGLVLGAARIRETEPETFRRELQRVADMLAATRPTAVNLFWALRRMMARADALLPQGIEAVVAGLEEEARAIAREDADVNRRIGLAGAELINDGDGVLTYCNTGALATAAYGTALGVIRVAHEQGKTFTVYACETRPVLQGARLTAWELLQEGIDGVLITDNMAGHLMQQGRIQMVVVGADRIAANGDTANKVGTYPLAVLAARHRVPFYVVAPTSTVDLATPDGEAIEIEQRDADEVRTALGRTRLAPADSPAYNPAFDVTPADLITAIVTERGVARPPYHESLAALCG